MQILVVVSLWWCVGVFSVAASAFYARKDFSSCTQIDFDEATLSSLRKCDYMQEFIVKRYDESTHFEPYRPETVHYLSHRWQGLTCGETVDTYSFNEETELRMAYNLVFDSGATLEVRVFDEERMDSENKPTLVEVWHTTASTNGWGFFREKLNKTVKQARIQIEANINAGSDLAIEYLTIFNYEVETEECSIIDEFATTTTVIPATTETTTIAAETTTQQPDTTTTHETTTTEMITTSTTLSTADDETTATTETSKELSTISSEQTSTTADTTEAIAATTTTTTTVTEIISTTSTNAPRDDTSMQPSSSTTQSLTSSYFTTDSSIPSVIYSTPTPTETAPVPPILEPTLSPKQWLWMTLTAVFAILFILAASAAIYLCFMNQHLQRISARLLDENGHYPGKKF